MFFLFVVFFLCLFPEKVYGDSQLRVGVNLLQTGRGCLPSADTCDNNCGCFTGTFNETAMPDTCPMNLFIESYVTGDSFNYYLSVFGFVSTDYMWVAQNYGHVLQNTFVDTTNTSCWRERGSKKVCYITCYSDEEAIVGQEYSVADFQRLCWYQSSLPIKIFDGRCEIIGIEDDAPVNDIRYGSVIPPDYYLSSSASALIADIF